MNGFIVVVGASRGIGLATVRLLSDQGFSVIGTSCTADGVHRIQQHGGVGLQLDLGDADAIEAAADEILRLSEGQISALVLNAGVGQPGAIEDVPLAAWRDTFEINLFGPIRVLQRLTPSLRAMRDARVLWVSSVLGMMALGFRGAYVASKFAMEGVIDTLQIEMHDSNVRVIGIQPGPIATDFRRTARKRFDSVDRASSVHATRYIPFVRRLEQEGALSPDTLPAEAVADVIMSALTTRTPASRYKICGSTRSADWLRRLAPRNLITRIGIFALKKECTPS